MGDELVVRDPEGRPNVAYPWGVLAEDVPSAPIYTLDEALDDPAYQSEDAYAGRAGMSWLQRWAITRRVPFESEPLVDPWVEDVAYPDP